MTIRSTAKSTARVKYIEDMPSLTEQHHKDSCDVNLIMARYQKTGLIDHVKKHGGDYGFCDGATFQEHMFAIRKANEMFHDLPSSAREYFDQKPEKFLDFVDSLPDGPEGTQQLVKLGLAPESKLPEKPGTEAPTEPQSTSSPESGEDG